MDKFILTLLSALLPLVLLPAQEQSVSVAKAKQATINWMSWEEAKERSKAEKRKILLNVYTEWCGWCKRMDQQTYSKPEVAQYINANFYPVRFDAEQKNELEYQGKTYEFTSNGKRGYHELAAELLRGRMSFPSVVFMDEKFELIQSIVGFKQPEAFAQIIAYFGEDFYKKTPWSTFQKKYKPQLIDTRQN